MFYVKGILHVHKGNQAELICIKSLLLSIELHAIPIESVFLFVRIYIPKSILFVCILLFTLTGFRYGNDLFEFSKHLEIFSNVYKTVQEEYVEEVPASEMAQHAIKSMLTKLDPYTVFYSEYQAEEALIERQGEYGGVGCRVVIKNHFPMVLEIEKGYGFDKADIKRGDFILKAGDIDLFDRPIDEMMQYFRGAPNTQFSVTLLRNNDTLIKTVTRSHIEQKSVSYQGVFDNKFGYIKLDEFGRDCAQEIAQALKNQIDSHKIQGLVLDLRNNGGGLLDQAVEIVGLFVPKNTLIVSLKGAHRKGNQLWRTPNEPLAPSLPVVVLVNESSASASEVVSGSLQDLDRALIMGSPSFGKGLVQNYKNLPYRTQMKITTARYHIPSGRCIQKIDYRHISNDSKQAFKTKNGRTVFDGEGVHPDVNINKSESLELLNWMKRELIIFDYANLKELFWKPSKSENTFELLSDFTNYASKDGSKKLSQSITKLITNSSDSSIFKQLNFFEIKTSAIENWISQDIKNNQEWYLFEIRQALFQRWFDKSKFHEIMLSKDPIISRAKSFLNSPNRINKIINPK